MSAPAEPRAARLAGFRTQLLLAMMLVVSAVAALALYFAERNLVQGAEQDLARAFQGDLAAWHNVQDIRNAALLERSRALVRKPRIHAALEDNALDLLYPSAEDELQDVMADDPGPAGEHRGSVLHAEFYRFLDQSGTVIPSPAARPVGALTPGEVAQLSFPAVPLAPQTGYLLRENGSGGLSEIITMPIVSTESGEAIAAIALGFRPFEPGDAAPGASVRRGIWLRGRVYFPAATVPPPGLADEAARAIGAPDQAAGSLRIESADHPQLLFFKQLNPGSHYPPAYEVCLYPLEPLRARQRQLRWRIAGAGALLLLGGLGASHFLAGRLSGPVEKLAIDSAENFAQRRRAEAALESTSEELQRAARFSADASHQLMTPVTVLRAGLEELLTQDNLTAREREELAALIHQTYRLSNVIKDLLLLSRMDAGRLQIEFAPVSLTQLIEAAIDDLSAAPEAGDIAVETDFPPALFVAGEKGYLGLILQNLLENARKYNQPGGRIRLTAAGGPAGVVLHVGNTGRPIPPAMQEHIFERFHRGAIGENVPGYGLGLNLARELARLHRGELRLVRSEDNWTEFEVRFRPAAAAPGASAT